MMLVVLGLLLGMAVLLWILVLAIMEANQQTKKVARQAKQAVVAVPHCGSKAA